MVLSPIEPVAPSTVTVRMSATAALLLRNGTALIISPNHKTAADAIGATPQEPKKSSHSDGCDKSIQPIQEATMAGNDLAGIRHTKTPLHRRFEEIAELRNHRKNAAYHQERTGFPEIEHGKDAGHREACDKTADGACPGLFGADARPEFRAANAAAGEIAAAISHPDDQQYEDQRDEAFDGIEAQQHRSDLGDTRIEES